VSISINDLLRRPKLLHISFGLAPGRLRVADSPHFWLRRVKSTASA
jgi:hypothetical protein